MSEHTYKHEGFEVGDLIKAFDFEPLKGRPDRYVVGTVAEVNRTGNEIAEYAHYVIDCVYDTTAANRIGERVYVPMEVFAFDYDNRVTKV